MRRRSFPITFVLLLSLATLMITAATGSGFEWTQFRGPAGDGHGSGKNIPSQWSESENVAWKTEIEGAGWSSPVVSDNEIWLTTAIEIKATEAEAKELLADLPEREAKQKQVATRILLRAIAVDLDSGKVMKDIELARIDMPDPIHTFNSYASPTPTIDENRIYCHFGSYGTFCLDRASGSIQWSKRYPLDHGVGPGSSPFIDGNKLVLVRDGVDAQYVMAVDKQSGEEIWKTNRPSMRAEDGDHRKAYSTPIRIDDAARGQLIIPGSQWIVSYDPEDGRELWKVDHGSGFSLVPRPVYRDGTVYFCSGFPTPELFAIRTDGSGDVTESHILWKATNQISKKPSPLLDGNLLYVISDLGIATCFDTVTGVAHWTKRVSGNYTASPILADGKIFFSSEEGKTTVISTGPEFQELAQNHLDGRFMASPAVVDHALILRTDTHLYKVQNK